MNTTTFSLKPTFHQEMKVDFLQLGTWPTKTKTHKKHSNHAIRLRIGVGLLIGLNGYLVIPNGERSLNHISFDAITRPFSIVCHMLHADPLSGLVSQVLLFKIIILLLAVLQNRYLRHSRLSWLCGCSSCRSHTY